MVPAAGGVVAAGLLIPGLMPPLMAIALLLAWLETTYGSRELSEFRGLARRLPVLALLLIISVLWFCGLPGLSVFPGLWKAWVAREQSGFLPGFESISLWPLLVPQVIVLWGWLRLLDALLLGPERLPQMPDALAERVELRQFGERLPEDLGRRERWTLTGLVAVGLILGVWPRLVVKPLAPAAAAPVDPQEHDGL
jgi:formate hydrogenlyase subunit 3/multisubunit Na+/H+ antiporter MnhD subunit